VQEKGNRFRFCPPDATGPGRMIDLLCMPDTQRARGGGGTVHHIAFRTADDATQRACREQLVELGFNVSPIMDRTYFHSIYFREPGGILFEIATDPPGFTADEKLEELGNSLRVPPWMEKAQIEGILPPITLPSKTKP
jgi:glyoxalase family protein